MIEVGPGWKMKIASRKTRERYKLPDNMPRIQLPRKPRRPSEFILHKLFNRAVYGGHPYPTNHAFIDPRLSASKFYTNFVPNFTCEDVENPFCYLRKFSNDGRYLLGINNAFTNLLVYNYEGFQSAAHLLQCFDYRQEVAREYTESTQCVQKNIFNTIFKERHSLSLGRDGFLLHKDFSIFLDDNRHVILMTSKLVSEDGLSYYQINRNNESLNLTQRVQTNMGRDFSMMLVNFVEGELVDCHNFDYDCINTMHQQGVSLFARTLAVLSVQHQTIYMFHISPSNKFIPLCKIGRFLNADDHFLITRTFPESSSAPAFRENFYTCLKQRLLAYIYRMVITSAAENQPNCLNMGVRDYYASFKFLESLRIWRLQLLDDYHILVKFEPEQTAKFWSSFKVPNLFIVYNYRSTVILNLFPQDSPELLALLEKYETWFKYPLTGNTTIANNCHLKESHERYKMKLANSRNANIDEATRHILEALPFNCQAFSYSPYLDASLFIYDEQIINSSDEPRPNPEYPTRFHYRSNDRLAFRWHTQQHLERHQRNKMLSFIHHPTDPFVISVMRGNSRFHINFHLWHFNPKLEEIAND